MFYMDWGSRDALGNASAGMDVYGPGFIFGLIFGVLCAIGGSSWEAVASIIIISVLVLIYCMLPGTKATFGLS